MQTFLPYADFQQSAECLDRLRLGKQRVEVLQILRTLNGESEGWRNHPAVLMWHGYSEALIEYGSFVCFEWLGRGYVDNCLPKILSYSYGEDIVYPNWFGDDEFHTAHQSNLVRKNPDHYRQYFPTVVDNLEYVWPEVAV